MTGATATQATPAPLVGEILVQLEGEAASIYLDLHGRQGARGWLWADRTNVAELVARLAEPGTRIAIQDSERDRDITPIINQLMPLLGGQPIVGPLDSVEIRVEAA